MFSKSTSRTLRIVIRGAPKELQPQVSSLLRDEVNQFLKKQRQSYGLGILPQQNTFRVTPRGKYQFVVNQDLEMVVVTPSYDTLKTAETLLEFEAVPIGWVDLYAIPYWSSDSEYPSSYTADLYLGNGPDTQQPFLYKGITYDYTDGFFTYELVNDINLTPARVRIVGLSSPPDQDDFGKPTPNFKYITDATSLQLAARNMYFRNHYFGPEYPVTYDANVYRFLVEMSAEQYPNILLATRELLGNRRPRVASLSVGLYDVEQYTGGSVYNDFSGGVGFWFDQPSGNRPVVLAAPSGLSLNTWVCSYVPQAVEIWETARADNLWSSVVVVGYRSRRTNQVILTAPSFSVSYVASAAVYDGSPELGTFNQQVSIFPLLPTLQDRTTIASVFRGEFPNSRITGMSRY